MLSVEEAQRLVLEEVALLPVEEIALHDAHGRVLREDVIAPRDLPPADNSAMDGYAVRAAEIATATADTPCVLDVTGDVAAGHPATSSLAAGTAMRIMTGADIPAGADTVVQVELTDGGTERVSVLKSLRSGANIRRRGEDMHEGRVVLRTGSVINAGEIALLTGVRKTRVLASRRPVVAVFSTGDELVDASEEPGRGQIVNTNGPLLCALVNAAGGVARDYGIVRDSHADTVRAFEDAADADVILSSGGVSVGAFDYVKGALEALGAETKFWRVAMKPGKPVVVSRLRECLVFGLPGNPVSSFVSFHLFVAPALRKALGRAEPLLAPIVATHLAASLKSPGDRRVYFRATVKAEGGELVAYPLASQSSGALTSMAGVNALVIADAGVQALEAGERVATVLLSAVS